MPDVHNPKYRLPRGFKKASKEQRVRLIFDHVRKHLLTQKAVALGSSRSSDDTFCMYLAPDGKACAVGCLMPASLRPEIHTSSVRTLLHSLMQVPKTRPWALNMWPHLRLLEELQKIHDGLPPSAWEEHLQKLKENLADPKYYAPE